MITLKCQGLSSLLACCLLAVLWTSAPLPSVAWAQAPGPGEALVPLPPAVPEVPAPLSGDELDQLVAPIALYPDALVAQILAGATYPTEVVEAARWQAANPGLRGAPLAAAVDSIGWDPSIKALTQFPSVLADMNNNLAWTSALGQAYFYQPQDVLNAVQVMRQRALAAGTLVNTPQQRIVEQDGIIMIEPVNPDLVYVPAYNPADIYGTPMAVYPGYSMGEMIAAGVLAFGAGVAVGVLADQAWGWHGWNTDWHHHNVIYQNNVYVSNTNNFFSVSRYRGGNFNRPAEYGRQGGFAPPSAGGPQRAAGAGHGYGAPANRPATTENRQAANRGPGQIGAPAEERRGAGTGSTYRSNAPANAPAIAENRRMASRGPAQMGAPVEARPGTAARPAYRPNTPAPQAVRNKPGPQANPFRGFGKAPATGLNKGAFARIAPGGEALAASARGRASMGRAQTPARAAPSAHNAARRPAPAAGHAAPSTHKH